MTNLSALGFNVLALDVASRLNNASTVREG